MLTNEFHGRGRIGNDELIKRNTGKDGKEGTDVCNFAVAIKRNGDTDKADWIDCTLYGKRVSALVKYAKRGTLIDFKGRIETKQNEYKGMKIKNTVVIIDEFELLGAFDYKSAKAGKKKTLKKKILLIQKCQSMMKRMTK